MSRSRRDPAAPRLGARPTVTPLKRALRELGRQPIDRRTTLGKALQQWRAQLIADLGGPDVISTQQLAVVDLAVTTKLLIDSIDTWLLKQPTLIYRRKRALFPVVLQRQQLADALARYMAQLGLERRLKTLDLAQALSARQVPPARHRARPSGDGGAVADSGTEQQHERERDHHDPTS
jgi:hypothetical protein